MDTHSPIIAARNTMATQTTRRALIGGAGLASIALIAPAMAIPAAGSESFRTIMDANDAARHRFNALPPSLEDDDPAAFEREERHMCEAFSAADCAVPTTWPEFVRLMEHMSDGGRGMIDYDNAGRLLTHAQSILRKEG